MSYLVKTEVFEGPLDLLLSLIEKRKLLINEVSLSAVTDDYIIYVENGNFSISESSDFIYIASTLLLIKSKSLLPVLDITEEEKGNIEDLETRLKIYKKAKELSLYIKESYGQDILFFKEPVKNIEPIFSPEKSITSDSLFESMNGIINSLPKTEKLPKVSVVKVVSLEEAIDSLIDRVKKSLKLSFRELSGRRNGEKLTRQEKIYVIVNFIAMLELVKRGVIAVEQENRFDDIKLQTNKAEVPNYK